MAPREFDDAHDGAVRVWAVHVGLMALSAFLMAGMGLMAWTVGVWPGSILAGGGVVLVLCWAVELWGDGFRDRRRSDGWGPAADRIPPSDRPGLMRRIPPAPLPCLPSGRRRPVKGGQEAIAERREAPLTGRRRYAPSAGRGRALNRSIAVLKRRR